MKYNKILRFVLVAFLFTAIFASGVHAAQDIISQILDPIAGSGFDFTKIYDAYGKFIDAGLLITLFIGISMFALGQKFGPQGKWIAIIIGIMLGIGAAYFMAIQNPPFTLLVLGPIAVIIFVFILGWIVYGLLSIGAGGRYLPGRIALSYLIGYSILAMISSNNTSIIAWISKNLGWVGTIMTLMWIFSIIIVIWQFFVLVANMFGQQGAIPMGNLWGNLPGQPPIGNNPPPNPQQQAQQLQQLQQQMQQQQTVAQLNQMIGQLQLQQQHAQGQVAANIQANINLINQLLAALHAAGIP